ncbi:MAG: hypothetical protein AAB774_02685 [Patescibacteria group bacterium]
MQRLRFFTEQPRLMRCMLNDMELRVVRWHFEKGYSSPEKTKEILLQGVADEFQKTLSAAKNSLAVGLKKIEQRLKFMRQTKRWGELSIAYLPISRMGVMNKLFQAGYKSMVQLVDDGPTAWKAISGIDEEYAHEIETALEEAIRIEVAVSPPRPKLEFKTLSKPISKRAQARAKKAEASKLQPTLS